MPFCVLLHGGLWWWFVVKTVRCDKKDSQQKSTKVASRKRLRGKTQVVADCGGGWCEWCWRWLAVAASAEFTVSGGVFKPNPCWFDVLSSLRVHLGLFGGSVVGRGEEFNDRKVRDGLKKGERALYIQKKYLVQAQKEQEERHIIKRDQTLGGGECTCTYCIAWLSLFRPSMWRDRHWRHQHRKTLHHTEQQRKEEKSND